MARYTGGYLKLWRSIDNHWIGRNVVSLGIWTKLLVWAVREPTTAMFDGQRVSLVPGQILTSLDNLATSLATNRNTIDRWLRRMEDDGCIETRKGHGGRIVTLCHWDDYQPDQNSAETPMGQESGRESGRGSGARSAHNGEVRSEKRECIPPPSEGSPSRKQPSPFDQVLAAKWIEWAKSERPSLKLRLTECAETLRKLREIDGYTEDQLDAVFVFVRKDDFWRPNALSPVGLRKPSKSNGLPKIENILSAMSRPENQDNFALAEAWARQPDPPKAAPPPEPIPPPRQKTPEEIEREKARRAEQLAEMRRIRQEGARGA